MRNKSPDLVVKAVGRRIGEIRGRAEITQAALAEKAGVGVRYLQRVEAGEINLTIKSLVRYAYALDIQVTELFAEPKKRRVRRGRPRG